MRLIDADALTDRLHDFNQWCKDERLQGTQFVEAWILPDMPTVDAVPVIRCRECKFYEVGQNEVDAWSACYVHIGRIIETWDDNFCGWAERREE